MSFNLAAARKLTRIRGNWTDVTYPAQAVVAVTLSPKDFFEPVSREDARSCVPTDGKNFSLWFDANSGRTILRGESMFTQLAVRIDINSAQCTIEFAGNTMRLTET